MEAVIIESIGKKKKGLSLTFKAEGKVLDYYKFEGVNASQDFGSYLELNQNEIEKVKSLNLSIRYQPFEYIIKFTQLETLHIQGAQILSFPKLKSLTGLNSIYINQFAKPTELKNLSTAPKLEELHIGNFTFNGPIQIENFDEIIKSEKLKTLMLSYCKFDEEELKRIVNLKQLSEFGVSQKVTTETLAFLSVKLKKVKSNELKAWQECKTPWGNIKINGKRKPYLDKEKDMDKIKKYEKKFDELRMKYAL